MIDKQRYFHHLEMLFDSVQAATDSLSAYDDQEDSDFEDWVEIFQGHLNRLRITTCQANKEDEANLDRIEEQYLREDDYRD